MRYRERLWPAWWVWLVTTLVIPAGLLVFLPISLPAALVIAPLLYLGVLALLIATTPVIEVTDTELRAGRARLPRSAIGAVASAQGAEATAERGVRLDARAWLLLRGWVDGVVKVELDDPGDPTPYWLLSSRRPEELATALATGGGASPSPRG